MEEVRLAVARPRPDGAIVISLELGGKRHDFVANRRIAARLVAYLAEALAVPPER